MHELEAREILGRHAGQRIEVGSCPIENPDVVDIVDAASMKLEGGFIRETSTKISDKTVCYPSVGAVENQLIVACAANESRDPVCALDVRRKLRVDICGGFEDSQHLLVFLNATVDVGITACHLVKALLLVDHVLEEEYVLVFVFGVPAEPVDRFAQALKRFFLAWPPNYCRCLFPTPVRGSRWVFRARSRRACRYTYSGFVREVSAVQLLPDALHAPSRVC